MSGINSVFYAESYHPIQAGSIDGTDILPHDNAVYRAHLCSSAALCLYLIYSPSLNLYFSLFLILPKYPFLQMTPSAIPRSSETLTALSSLLASLTTPPNILFARCLSYSFFLPFCSSLL